MPKTGYKSITLKNASVSKLDAIAKNLSKTIPETVEYLTDLFAKYIDLLKTLNSPTGPTTEQVIELASRLQNQPKA